MNPSLHFVPAILAACLFTIAPGPATACEPDESASAPLYLAVESPVRDRTGLQVGQGHYSYRFVVRDPLNIKRPYRHGRYQVNIEGASFPDGRTVYRGVTDLRGRTASFRFARPVPVRTWFVQPLSGQGELGESFRLSAEGDCKHDMINFPYMLDGKLGPIVCGSALPGGTTVRYMSTMVTQVRLYTGYLTSGCQSLQRRVNPVMARPDPAGRIAGLQELLRDPRLKEHRELLQSKIDAAIIHHGSLEQLRALLEGRLGAAGASAKARSDVLNSLAYNLVAQTPPRHTDFANELLDQSLALDENLFNLDSKAWALHRAGQHEAALGWADRALTMFGRQCNDAERSSYQESLAHRGMILWTLKQPAAALNDWAMAELTGDGGGGWTNALPSWQSISPLIKARTAELQAEGFKNPLCSESRPKAADQKPASGEEDGENQQGQEGN